MMKRFFSLPGFFLRPLPLQEFLLFFFIFHTPVSLDCQNQESNLYSAGENITKYQTHLSVRTWHAVNQGFS